MLPVLVLLSGAGAAGATSDRQSAAGPAQIEAGRKIYEARKCGACHMVAGKGNIRYPLDGVAVKLSVEQLRRWLTDTAEMEGALPRLPAVRMSEWLKANRKISDRDRDLLVAYLASLK